VIFSFSFGAIEIWETTQDRFEFEPLHDVSLLRLQKENVGAFSELLKPNNFVNVEFSFWGGDFF